VSESLAVKPVAGVSLPTAPSVQRATQRSNQMLAQPVLISGLREQSSPGMSGAGVKRREEISLC